MGSTTSHLHHSYNHTTRIQGTCHVWLINMRSTSLQWLPTQLLAWGSQPGKQYTSNECLILPRYWSNMEYIWNWLSTVFTKQFTSVLIDQLKWQWINSHSWHSSQNINPKKLIFFNVILTCDIVCCKCYILNETGPIWQIFSHHCGYWWPGVLHHSVPGHQWPYSWLCIHVFPAVDG